VGLVVCKKAHPLSASSATEVHEKGEGVPWFRKYYDVARAELYLDPFIDTSISNYRHGKRNALAPGRPSRHQFSITSLRGRYTFRKAGGGGDDDDDDEGDDSDSAKQRGASGEEARKSEDGEEGEERRTKLRQREVEVVTDEGAAVTLRPGDFVYMRPDDEGKRPWVAQIEKLWEAQSDDMNDPEVDDDEDEGVDVRVKVRWLFRAEDTILQDYNSVMISEKELFLSNHVDENSVQAIVGKCRVVYLPPDRLRGPAYSNNARAGAVVDHQHPSLGDRGYGWICEEEDAYFYRYAYNEVNYSFIDPHVEGGRDEDCDERFQAVTDSDTVYWKSREEKARLSATWDPASKYARTRVSPPPTDEWIIY
jgi:hypothetical protein